VKFDLDLLVKQSILGFQNGAPERIDAYPPDAYIMLEKIVNPIGFIVDLNLKHDTGIADKDKGERFSFDGVMLFSNDEVVGQVTVFCYHNGEITQVEGVLFNECWETIVGEVCAKFS
jgi:hypothetical protein